MISAIYCKKCKKIMYSLTNRHFNSCECGCFIDGEGLRVGFKDKNDIITLQLDDDFMLKNIFQISYNNKCRLNMENMGTFQIHSHSNKKFYSQLIINWSDFEEEFDSVVTSYFNELYIEISKKKGLVQ